MTQPPDPQVINGLQTDQTIRVRSPGALAMIRNGVEYPGDSVDVRPGDLLSIRWPMAPEPDELPEITVRNVGPRPWWRRALARLLRR